MVNGPFTTAVNVAGTTATINGLTNGTTNYFVVTGVNSTGQSLNSNVVAATPSGTTQSTSLSSISVKNAVTIGGNTVLGAVTLSSAAPTGGVTVALSSSVPSAASVPASVTVPAGATTATFNVTTYPVNAITNTTLTATYNGVSKSVALQVYTPVLSSLTLSSSSVKGGASITGTVTLVGT